MWIRTAALLGAIGVGLGAFGAHGLEDSLTTRQLEVWTTAVDYHLIHAVALLAVALYGRAVDRGITWPAAAFATGIALFSGSLYVLALDGPRWLGPVTPIGGVAFLVGWIGVAALAREPG